MELPRTGDALEAAARRWRRCRERGEERRCKDIADQIVTALQPLIGRIARNFASPFNLSEDLEQDGRIAVIGALERYDANRPATFKTFVHTAIAGGIRNAVRNVGGVGNIRLPAWLQERRVSVLRAVEHLESAGNLDPTYEQIGEIVHLTSSQVKTALLAEARGAHLPTLRFGDCIAASNSSEDVDLDRHPGCAISWVDDANRSMIIAEALDRLRPEQRDVLIQRYWEGATLGEISENSVPPVRSREAIRQRICSAQKRLLAILGPDAIDLLS